MTSANDLEATVYGKEEHLSHADRYDRAEEFLDVVKKFWFSIEGDAVVANKETGQFIDVSKVHPVKHEGKWFKVSGLLDAPARRKDIRSSCKPDRRRRGKSSLPERLKSYLQLANRCSMRKRFMKI
ncbi:hypothetical protein PACILC2_51650 [Paenibacillus cisolokensis]|uniref:Uncharacterized protein n=1 Tax=Paenibacillus cisolokensis TaxID=1658519 RepID=A0ABQ4NEE1_9BACL|nr:hypothetical protein PACILC2_51650 [Paenibacillus cisolokensis]